MARDITITLGAAVERWKDGEDRRKPHPVVYFADSPALPEHEGEDAARELSVRAANFARAITARLSEGSGGDIIEGYPPEAEYTHLWHIYIKCQPTHGVRAAIGMDYERLPGCPNGAAADMMELYAHIRKCIGGARITNKNKKEKQQ